MFWWAVLRASAAFFIVVKTAVFVLALSKASRCISMVDRVPRSAAAASPGASSF